MPTSEQISQFIVGTILPPLIATFSAWIIVKVPLLSGLFKLSANQIGAELTQLGVFAVTAAISWLTAHHILLGHYTPSNKASTQI